MRIASSVLCAAMFLSLAGSLAAAAPPPKAEVMIVADSPLSAKRQAQISDVVDRLARFHPTKVLIEEPFGNPKYQIQYSRYL